MRKLTNFDDTICSISAPTGGAISIVRLSGAESVSILKQIFSCATSEFESHRIYYGWIMEDAQKIDEVLVSVMLAPRTFTTQDVVEINCHGGALITQKILQMVIAHGARLAEPGEFAKRAYLSGRIDLSRAEAIMDVISAQSEGARKVAIGQLGGQLGKLLTNCADDLLNLLARIEMALDYPEHEEADILNTEIATGVKVVISQIDKLLQTATSGRVMRDGIKTVILGEPNVGKSSLLNALMGEDRAIVTEIAGTTRDVLREHIRLGDVFLNLADTAGIRETDDIVERIGVERSVKEADDADLVLLVLDATNFKLNSNFTRQMHHKHVIIVVNKCDLQKDVDITQIELDAPVIYISAKDHTGIDDLTAKINEIFNTHGIEYSSEIVSNTRHIALLHNTAQSLKNAMQAADDGMFADFLAIDIQSAYASIAEITGAVADEELINRIFSKFCLGK